MTILVVYNSNSISLIYEMYRHHRMAYESHVKQLVGLFIATEVTLGFVLFSQAMVLFKSVCAISEAQLDGDYSGICKK